MCYPYEEKFELFYVKRKVSLTLKLREKKKKSITPSAKVEMFVLLMITGPTSWSENRSEKKTMYNAVIVIKTA